VAAALKTIGSMRFSTANTADVSIDHILLWNCQRFNEMHKIVEGFLDVESTALKQEGHGIGLKFKLAENVGALDLF